MRALGGTYWPMNLYLGGPGYAVSWVAATVFIVLLAGRFGFISAHRLVYGVKRLCRVLGVARSAFYAWLGREPAAEKAA
ncbi:hypothetical protein AB0J37_25885 [Microbispora rosea]|uniref:hypothetical protein n=1 Tax=Microbispora rosea TaxID=58117 RepID=UPI003432D9C9